MNKKRRATLEKPLLSDWRSSKAQWNMATPVHPAERCMVGPFVECHVQFRSAHQTHADTCSSLFIPGTDRVGERERRQRFNLVSTFKFQNRLCSWKASNPIADGKETSPVQWNNIFREQRRPRHVQCKRGAGVLAIGEKNVFNVRCVRVFTDFAYQRRVG